MNSLGIIGGGQLGMFICQAAKKLGIKTSVLSESEEFSARNFCDQFFVGKFNNFDILNNFINSANFFTIETENIPLKILEKIASKKKLFPNPGVIKICQNRLKEKKFLNSLNNIKTAKFFNIDSFEDLKKNLKIINNNGILKTSEFGYDGKGQYKIRDGKIDKLKGLKLKNFILEEILDFDKEISVIVCRKNEKIISYPVVENIHRDSILRETIYPANIDNYISKKATEIAIEVANKINLNGILAVEMFVMKDKSVLINELAPRPHNSGHWTMDYCEISQFHNLINTIFFELPKSPKPISSCKMVNVIGSEFLKKNEFEENFKFYDYFKKEIKDERKMGHYIVKI
ncbi:MAG: 5-(carboxyamino)imidazole ribonucleotide synthase [Alphaproteobacteria bacterium]|nr:5-(carboxyamino)imidazole ribonucleotide synthase [Alphaproteobacteria bacterium]|tara:strand:+ start:906 stop:1940 length:1035 start_codon:yes stop_codon:yes gene_type:complete